jgi:hypothetical protein
LRGRCGRGVGRRWSLRLRHLDSFERDGDTGQFDDK